MRITSAYGPRNGRQHRGIDIGARSRGVDGDPVYSVNAGKVVFAQYKGARGDTIVVQHDTFSTIYQHLSGYACRVGDYVSAGQVIGRMGNTGSSTGTHLHFETHDTTSLSSVWANSYVRNPSNYLAGATNSTLEQTTTTYTTTSYASSSNGISSTSGIGSPVYGPVEYTRNIPDLDKQTLYDKQFGRRYRMFVLDSTNSGVDVSNLHVTFKVVKTILLDTQYSIIRVYNLNTNTEAKIIQDGVRIVIEAGYEGATYGLIFDGDIIQVIRGKENATDFYVDIVALDSDRFLNSGFVNFSIKRGQTQREVIEQIAMNSTENANIGSISNTYENNKLTRGKVVFGLAKDYLYQISKSNSAQFYMDNGTINIIRAEDLPSGEIFRIDYTSGLTGTPKQTDQGVDLTTLLNPRLKPNTLISIDNATVVERQFEQGSLQKFLDVDGVYRIVKVTYEGDNRGQKWYCNLECVGQAGYLPQVIADPTVNPWQ